MPPYLKKGLTLHRRVSYAVFAALLLAGCSGYFSDEWPNLAEGFADAAERDAALAEIEGEAEAAADDDTAQPVAARDSALDMTREAPSDLATPVVPAAVPTPTPAQQPMNMLTPEEILRLTIDLDAASDKIEIARQAYLTAKAAIREGAKESAKGRWLTAQLRLTGLSRATDGLGPILARLPVTGVCGTEEGAEGGTEGEEDACALARRAEETSKMLADYLDNERRQLIDYEPAGPS